MVDCNICNQKVRAIKSIELFRAPRVLVIKLQRFEYDLNGGYKLETLVDFPLNGLDMSGFVCSKP